MEFNFSVKTALLATIPFILILFMWFVISVDTAIPNLIQDSVCLLAIMTQFFILGYGWVKEFPRWTIPSIGFCGFISLLLPSVSVPPLTNGELLGYWGYLPLFLTILVSISINPSLKPGNKIYRMIKDDASLILFGLYGFLPFFILILCDEIYGLKIVPCIIINAVVISLGVFYYLRSEKKIIKSLYLISATLVSFIFTLLFITL